MTNKEFVEKLKDIATKYKTLYVMGCFGAPLNDENKKRLINHHEYNANKRKAIIAVIGNSMDGFRFLDQTNSHNSFRNRGLTPSPVNP